MAIYRLDCSLARASVFIGRRNSPKHPRQEDQARSIGNHQPEKKCLVSIHAHLTDYALIPQYDDRMARLRRGGVLFHHQIVRAEQHPGWFPIQRPQESGSPHGVPCSSFLRLMSACLSENQIPRELLTIPAIPLVNLRGTLPRTRERSLKGGSFAASYSRRSGREAEQAPHPRVDCCLLSRNALEKHPSRVGAVSE